MPTQISFAQQQEIKRLINLSCSLYSSMEQVYLTLEQLQLTDTDVIAPLLQQLQELKGKAQQVDSILIPQLKRAFPSEKLTPVIETREKTIARLIKLNKKLTENTKRYKAAIHDELATLHRNRNALSGYKTVRAETSVISGAY